MNVWLAFLLGIAGALAPEVVRLYSIREDPEKFRWSPFYLIVSLLFGCLGGLLVLALPATTYWGAIYVGISTPVVVNTVVRKVRDQPAGEQLRGPKATARLSTVDSYLNGL
jgi:hypothetical protein